MNRCNGFSLTEVLVALLLVTTTVLALFTQQWRVVQLFNQAHVRMDALLKSDNASEQAYQNV